MVSDFNLFDKELPWYGVLFVAGLLLGGFASSMRCKRRGMPREEAVYAACFGGIGGVIGAKLLSVLTSINYIIEYNLSFMDVMRNGFVFYGGLIGGFFGILIYCRIYKLKLADYLDIFAVSVPLGHSLGRIGCFLSGCCFGVEVPGGGFFTVTYTEAWGVPIGTPTGVPLLAVQLIEALCLIVLYVVLETIFRKTEKRGVCTYVYLFSYATIRFVLEFFRGDTVRGFILGMSTSQFISLLLIVIAAASIVFFRVRKKGKKSETEEVEAPKPTETESEN